MSESEIFTNNSYIAEAAGEEITAADKILHEDFAILSNEDFINKYGEDAFNSMAAQRAVIDDAAVNALASGTRSWGEAVGDTAKNIISGALTGATGAASLLTTPVRPLSESFANLTRDINEFSQSIGSDAEKAQRKLYEFKQEGLKARLDREIREAESQGKSVSFFEKIGKEALGSVDNLISTGHGAELIGSGLGSLLVGGPMTKGVSKAASFIGSKTPALSNAINKAAQQSATIAKIKEAAPWMTAMGLQEGGGAYGDMLLKGLEVSTEELMANSPEFQTLYKDYRSDGLNHEQAAEEARRDLAFTAARVTGALTAGAAGVANYLTAGLGKGLDKASLARSIISPLVAKADDTALSSIKDGLLEPVEEAITEGLGQAASNFATKLYLDKNQALDEDIGSSMAEGAVGGLGISGIRGAEVGVSLASGQINDYLESRKEKQEAKPKPIVFNIEDTAPSESPMKVTDNKGDTRTPTQVALDTQELVKQNKETLDTLFNPETSLSDEETGFNTSSLDLKSDLKEKYGVDSKAELVNKIIEEEQQHPSDTKTPNTEDIIVGRGEDTWKDSNVNEVKVGGKDKGSKYEEGILTRPGTAPNTWNGQKLEDIQDPEGGKALGKFYSSNGSEYVYTDNGYTRRVKFEDSNTKGEDAGVNNWKKTFFLKKDSDAHKDWSSGAAILNALEKFQNRKIDSDGTVLVQESSGTWRPLKRSDILPKSITPGSAKDTVVKFEMNAKPSKDMALVEFSNMGADNTFKADSFHTSGGIGYVENQEASEKEQDLVSTAEEIVRDIENLKNYLHKVANKTISISPEAQLALIAQYKSLLAARKNLIAAFDASQVPETLEADKTAYDAINNPETVNLERLDKALKSSDKFNEQQIKVISSIRDFYAKEKANTAHREQIKEISPTSSLVSKNVIWGEEDSYNETGKYSLKQLASEVYKGIAYGNEAKARASLENVRKLAQHFENKVKAANTSYKNGGKEVKFDRLNAKTKEFDKNQGTVYWDPKEDNSLYLARALEYDLARVVQAYNHLVDLAPNLGFQPITEYAHLTDGKGAGIDLPTVKEISPTLNTNPDEEILAPWEGEDEFSVPETKQEVPQEPEIKKEEVVTETTPSKVASESSTETPVITEVTKEIVSEEKKPETTDKEKEAKKIESIKVLGEKIRERFKKTLLAHLFTSKGGLGSRLNILAQFPKYKLTDVINNPELKKRFLAYDSDPSKVSAITKLNKAERDAWTRILNLVDSEIIPGINKRAQDSLLSIEAKKKAYGKDTSNLNGNYHLNLFKDGKYPEDLVRAVSLATISSVLQSQHSKDNEQLAEMLGIEEAQLSTLPVKQILLAQNGMNRFSLLTDIVKKTKNYLDVRELSDIPLGQTEGVIAAIAHGALEALARSKSELGISPVKLTIPTQEGRETPQILVLNRKLDDVIAGNTYFLDNLLLDSKSGLIKEFWMSSSNMPVFPKLNHTDQDIKEDQIKAIKNRQKVEYNINQEAYDLFNAMGEKGLIAFFSENPEGKEDLYHEDHLASIEGKNLALSRTFKIMQHEYEVASEIAKNCNIPLRNVKRHYSYNISKVGRQQMEGAATPQGDKIIREVMSCTRSVVNLNDPENKALYTRCIAQGFGIKVNNLSLNEIEAELEKIQKSDAFKLIQEFFKKEKPTTDEILLLKDAFKVAKIDATAVGLMCAKDYCKFLDQPSDTKALSKYETYVYLEADGVTNGTANLLMLTNAKELDEETLIALERVGVKYGSDSGKSLAQIKAENPEAKDDTYTWVAKEISKDLKEISEDLLNAYKTVFEFFGDFDSENNAFKRNVVKNPVTTVGYGAGVNTLALKIYRDLEDKFNTKISEANVKYMQDPEHSSWLSAFTGIENPKEALAKVKELNDAVKLIASNSEQGPNASLLPLEALKNLKGLDLVSKVKKVKFLSENTKEHKKVYTFGFYTLGNAINEATNKNLGKKNRFGEKLDSKSTLTYFNNLNNLSYFLQKFTYEFLEKKALESLGNQKQFGLTNAQYKAINAAARKFALVLDSGSRVIYPAKFKRVTSKNYIYTSQPVVESKREAIIDPKTGKRTYGKEHFNLKGQVTPDKIKDLSFAPEVMQPANPGVALMPGMIIGFGDAEMMSYLSDLPRSLDVFDGDNFPINLINKYGVLANEAVWKSWQTNLATVVKHSFANVISSVTPDFFDSFWDSLVADPNSANTNEFISFVSNAFYELSYPDIGFEKGKFVLSKKTPNGIIRKTLTKDVLFKLITTNQISELHDLEVKFAKTIAARKAVNMSVDQMASSENPYFHEGTDSRELSIEEVLAIYNNTYASTHVEPSKVDLTKKDNPLLTEIPSASSPNFSAEISEQSSEEKTETPQSSKLPEPKVEPVEEITVNRKKMRVSLRKLRDILYRGLTPKQLKLFKSIRGIDATNFLKTYTIYSGSREELNALLREDAVSASLNEGDKGLYNPGTKTLYIVGNDATTTFHEMIHAFVADKVTTVCSELGNDFRPQIINGVPPTVVSAVIALKDIAADFISEDFTIDTDPRLVEVQAIIRDYFEKGQIDAGINELIAYSLSDETVGNYFSGKLGTFDLLGSGSEGFFKTVKQYILKTLRQVKRILFGSTSGGTGNDVLTEIAFYTRIIHTKNVSTDVKVSEMLKAVSASLAGQIPAFKQISDLVTDAIKKKAPNWDKIDNLRNKIINKLIPEISSHIPSMDMSEQNACELILEAFLGVNKVHPEVFSRTSDMYQYARSKVTVEDFMQDPTDSTQRPAAEEKYYALFGDNLTSNANLKVPTFFAIALSSSEVKSVLSGIEVKRTKESTSEFFLDKKLEEAGSFVINKLSDILNSSNESTVDDLLVALADSLIKTSLEEAYKPSNVKKQVDKLNSRLGKTVQEKAEKVLAWGNNNKLDHPFIKGIKAFIAAISVPFTKEDTVQRAFSAAERELSSIVNEHNAIGHVITDLIGRTDDNGEVYDLIKPIKADVQQARSRYKEVIPKLLKEHFSRKLEDSELKQLYFGLGKIDIASLGLGPIVRRYFSSPSYLKQEIKRLEGVVKDPDMLANAKHLATYIATGKITTPMLLKNAEAIVANLHKKATALKPLDANLVTAVDQLTTMYAIQMLDSKTVGTINKLFASEKEGMNILVGALKFLKTAEEQKDKGNARFNALKGYIPAENHQGYSIVLGTPAQEDSLLAQGYIRREAYSGAPNTYYYSLDFSRSPFNEGVFQIVKESVNGADVVTGFSQEIYGKITGPDVWKHFQKTKNLKLNTEEAYTPVFNAYGELMGYEKTIAQAVKDKYLRPNYDITSSIGAMQGRQYEEKIAKIKNEALIKKLASAWNHATYSQRRGYVSLEDRMKNDPVLTEAWELIPKKYQMKLRAAFNGGSIMIPATMVEDIIGIRSASIGDIYTGVSRWSPRTQAYARQAFKIIFGADEGKALRVLSKIENTLKRSMSALRTTIVIRSLVVPIKNIVSNIFDLLICGVSPAVLAKEAPRIIIQIEKYQKIQKQLIEQELLLQSGQANTRAIRTKIASLKENLEKLEDIKPLIDAGEFSTVADLNQGDEDTFTSAGDYLGFLETLAEKSPKELKNIMRYALISKDTALYKALHKTVVYGDFVAKCILYKHLKARGNSEKTVLALVKEHFVDYDRISGRTRDYLESIGAMWFYNYKLRILKTALWLMRHNPLYALMSVTLPIDAVIGDFDTPITENIVAKFKDLLNTLGTDMASRAPFMNLWVNLFT